MPKTDRPFDAVRRGDIRDDVILRSLRNALRVLIDPDTGAPFTEEAVIEVTQRGSAFFLEADGLDLALQASQARARYLADQLRPRWANTAMLDAVHGPTWLGAGSRLPATGGSGPVVAYGVPGTTFVGSTTIGDPAACVAVDQNGVQYQVLVTGTVPAGATQVTLEMGAINTGSDTNPPATTTLTWSVNKPVGAQDDAEVDEDFSGGFDVETDTEYAARIEQFIAYRPANGNAAHFVAWARAASNAIESAFIYPAAFRAGSVLICVLQKRGSTEGPEARTDVAPATLIAARNYLTPPDSPVVPQRAYVVVVPPNEQDSGLRGGRAAERARLGSGDAVEHGVRHNRWMDRHVALADLLVELPGGGRYLCHQPNRVRGADRCRPTRRGGVADRRRRAQPDALGC